MNGAFFIKARRHTGRHGDRFIKHAEYIYFHYFHYCIDLDCSKCIIGLVFY